MHMHTHTHAPFHSAWVTVPLPPVPNNDHEYSLSVIYRHVAIHPELVMILDSQCNFPHNNFIVKLMQHLSTKMFLMLSLSHFVSFLMASKIYLQTFTMGGVK